MPITIIGQPEVADWFVAIQVRCTCGAQFQLVGQPGSMRACKGTDGRGADCGRVYKIDMIPVVLSDGTIAATPIVYKEDGTIAAGLLYGTVPPK